LRRDVSGRELFLRVDDLEIDLLGRRVVRGGLELDLTRRGDELPEKLPRHKKTTAPRGKKTPEGWKESPGPRTNKTARYNHSGTLTNSIDVYINSLRKKVEAPERRQLIHTVRGVGYVVREQGSP